MKEEKGHDLFSSAAFKTMLSTAIAWRYLASAVRIGLPIQSEILHSCS